MKSFKIILSLFIAVAVAIGIVLLCNREEVEEVPPVIGGDNEKEITIEKRIKEKIEEARNDKFCNHEYDSILNTINLFFKDQPANAKTYTLKLQGAYRRKFVLQANYVFDRKIWNKDDIKTIRTELYRCHQIFPDNENLKAIRLVLSNYDNLKEFDKRVTKACKQSPKCLKDYQYLYKPDPWNVSVARDLMEDIPTPTGKITNSPYYRSTREEKVKEKLKKSHVNFINKKMERSFEEVKNFTPYRTDDYRRLSGLIDNYCLKEYVELWGVDTNAQNWANTLKAWKKYTIPQDDNIN